MRRALMVGLAAGVAGLAVPTAPSASAAGELGGFAATAVSTPVRVEIYERMIPLPTDPQAELNLAYTKAGGTSGPQGAGRASYLWPGAAVGDGFKVIADQLQLPPEVGEQGYPFQVNATYPGDQGKQKDEPFPGLVMRTSSDAEGTVAKAGFSSTGDAKDSSDGDEAAPEGPGLPGLPAAVGKAVSGKGAKGAKAAKAADEPPNDGGLGALSALIKVGAATSVSRAAYATDTITTAGTATIADLSILNGVITADQLRLSGRTDSSLSKSESSRTIAITGLEIGGTPVTLTKDGIEVAGQGGAIPAPPGELDAALAEIGVKISLPTVTTSDSGNAQEVRGVTVEIDLAKLRNRVDTTPIDGPLGEAVAQLPDQLGPLKGLLGAPTQARPRIVLVLGDVSTDATASPAVEFDVTDTAGSVKGGGAPALSGGAAGGAGGSAPAASAPLAGGETQEVVPTTQTAVQNTAAGLPPLGSVPGMLLLLGLVIASGVGWWLQKVGGVVLGAGSACSHGLDSGIPDLRKA